MKPAMTTKLSRMTWATLLALAALAACAVTSKAGAKPTAVADGGAAALRVWPSTPPAGCPFLPSKDIGAIGFTGRHAEYEGADTWYPSWAADGDLYSPFADGVVEGQSACSWGKKPCTGHARIIGDDPLNLKITDVGVTEGAPAPYGGRYPCGSLVHDGVWYYGMGHIA